LTDKLGLFVPAHICPQALYQSDHVVSLVLMAEYVTLMGSCTGTAEPFLTVWCPNEPEPMSLLVERW
jgi:hypothetical protein